MLLRKCLVSLLVICIHLEPAATFRDFLRRIPNARRVQNPCFSRNTSSDSSERWWRGVGHLDRMGRGQLNSFGRDFMQSGHYWTKTLCRKDSDGDGLTNGEELGDPYCMWSQADDNSLEFFSVTISHPGICEPIGSMKCAKYNAFLPCSSEPKPSKFGKQTLQLFNGRHGKPAADLNSQIKPARYMLGLVRDDLKIHRLTSICPMLVGNARQMDMPKTIEEAEKCQTDRDCRFGKVCVEAPTNFFKMSICCPSTILGQSSVTSMPQYTSNSHRVFFGYHAGTTPAIHYQAKIDLITRNKCFSAPPKQASNSLQPCRPLTILWWFESSSASCHPFYATATQCDVHISKVPYFSDQIQCLEVCRHRDVSRYTLFGNRFAKSYYGGKY